MSASLLERLEAFRQSDEERYGFLKVMKRQFDSVCRANAVQELVEANSKLESELNTARSDYLDQLNSRRLWQDKAHIAEAKLKDSQESTVSNPSVAFCNSI